VVSFGISAQTSTTGFVEVKGVETRWEKYKGDDNKDYWGVSFTNKNTFAVTVEAELWRAPYVANNALFLTYMVNTKSFMLQKDESYLWKLDVDYYRGYYGGYNSSDFKLYIKFKAYR
jgi:hypothetical protein